MHRVARFRAERFMGVCTCEPSRCSRHTIARDDLTLRRLDAAAFTGAVAEALGASSAFSPVPGLHQTWTIGELSPRVGRRFRILMTAQRDAHALSHVVDSLVAMGHTAFVLCVPTCAMLVPAAEIVLARAKACSIALADEIELIDDGALVTRRPAAEVLGPFLAGVLPTAYAAKQWSGKPLTAEAAAPLLRHASGSALLQATRKERISEGDPFWALRQGGPGRTAGGKFFEDAVLFVKGLLADAEGEHDAGVAERLKKARAAKAKAGRPDPGVAERRVQQALTRQEKKTR